MYGYVGGVCEAFSNRHHPPCHAPCTSSAADLPTLLRAQCWPQTLKARWPGAECIRPNAWDLESINPTWDFYWTKRCLTAFGGIGRSTDFFLESITRPAITMEAKLKLLEEDCSSVIQTELLKRLGKSSRGAHVSIVQESLSERQPWRARSLLCECEAWVTL